MNPTNPHRVMAVPATLHARQEVAAAIRALVEQQREAALRLRRTEVAAARRDLAEIGLLLHQIRSDLRMGLRVALRKYSADQPRVPAGNPDGGEWTKESQGSSPSGSSVNAPENNSNPYLRYAMLDTSTGVIQSDAPNPNTQLAGGSEEDEGEARMGVESFEMTFRQQSELNAALSRLQSALLRVRRIDPSWNPPPGVYELSAQGKIRSTEVQAEEADQYLLQLRQLALPRDPRTGDLIVSRDARTGDPFIDYTTEKLQDILDDVIDKVGPRRDLTPQQYGTLVHTEFAKAVRAAGLRGIDPEDVEKTFGVEPNASYGAEHSIRVDAPLRDDDGDIIVIYDVKTGRGMRQLHAIKLRLRTGSDATVPIIEIYPNRDPVWKFRRGQFVGMDYGPLDGRSELCSCFVL